MIVKFDRSGLKQTKWSEYAMRFAFGGLITAATGMIGHKWGPVIAGLFLAFPAIFPASATIVEKHEREKKQRKGLQGEQRGIEAAADDAMGAALGSIGLLAFAGICWVFISRDSPLIVLPVAAPAWMAAAGLAWMVRKRWWRRLFHSSQRRRPDLASLPSRHR